MEKAYDDVDLVWRYGLLHKLRPVLVTLVRGTYLSSANQQRFYRIRRLAPGRVATRFAVISGALQSIRGRSEHQNLSIVAKGRKFDVARDRLEGASGVEDMCCSHKDGTDSIRTQASTTAIDSD